MRVLRGPPQPRPSRGASSVWTRPVSPATVALAAYRRWGAGLFDRLEGAFALVVHDAGSGLTLAGVDPCCILPLYLTVAGGDVLIASEAKAFLRASRLQAATGPAGRRRAAVLRAAARRQAALRRRAGPAARRALAEVDAGGCDLGDPALGRASPAAAVAARRRLPRPARGRDPRARPPKPTPTEGVLLPLTGGLDSRLFAAAAPRDSGSQRR